MTHPADFNDAHRRHWEDAELLFAHERWSNSDQLYAFSAECGLKMVMQALGLPVDKTAPQERKYRQHVQYLWPLFITFVQERKGAKYLSLLPSGAPFADWSHDNRYAHRSHFQKSDVTGHRKAACGIYRMVQRAKEEGLL